MTQVHSKKHSLSHFLLMGLIGVMMSVGLSACGGQAVDMKEVTASLVALDETTLPADIKLASSAVLMRMKGYGDGYVRGVSFPEEAALNMKAIGMNYDGFVVRGINILNYGAVDNGAELAAIMIFEDAIGRRAGVRMLVNYQASGAGIAITRASVVPVYAMEPRVEAYVVPFDPMVDQDAITADHNTLYAHAVRHGVAVDQLPAQTIDADVFMFVMDRSSPTSKTVGRVSENVKPASGFEDATTVLDFSGWQVAVISGEISPRSNNTLYAKLLHTPGDEAAWYHRRARLQGLYGLTLKALQQQ